MFVDKEVMDFYNSAMEKSWNLSQKFRGNPIKGKLYNGMYGDILVNRRMFNNGNCPSFHLGDTRNIVHESS